MPKARNIDSIHIERLELDCLIGVNPWERLAKQRITIDITMDVDLSAVGNSDSIRDTVDYSVVAKAVTAEVNSSSYILVETLAARIAEICMVSERVQSVDVTLRKPGALRNAAAAGVTIRRSR
jgi:FolB domain-containing protein